MLEAIMFAHEEIKRIVEFQEPIIAELGKNKIEVVAKAMDEAIEQSVREYVVPILEEAVRNPDKKSREEQMDQAKIRFWNTLARYLMI
jgi:polyribonucleotide nucleotidyltransferase